jgi:hypothetical protein
MFNEKIGHGSEFLNINKILLKYAINCGIYKYKDYSKYPFLYNNLIVNSNIL